ncbi:MAG: hypothetical protein HW416_2788 [Chloroflexi bacterium]|jgi:hypothetical protein|nr:hypothetical protein [Chloroflexota bacterium]
MSHAGHRVEKADLSALQPEKEDGDKVDPRWLESLVRYFSILQEWSKATHRDESDIDSSTTTKRGPARQSAKRRPKR